jgi:hypothetical protein
VSSSFFFGHFLPTGYVGWQVCLPCSYFLVVNMSFYFEWNHIKWDVVVN